MARSPISQKMVLGTRCSQKAKPEDSGLCNPSSFIYSRVPNPPGQGYRGHQLGSPTAKAHVCMPAQRGLGASPPATDPGEDGRVRSPEAAEVPVQLKSKPVCPGSSQFEVPALFLRYTLESFL